MSKDKMDDQPDHLQTNVSSNQSGSNDFVKKLFQMLQEDSYKSIVRWTKNGDSFVVIDNNEFTKEILPRHFKHSNFASFVRQLNKYDFHKVKVSSEAKQNYEYGDDAWEFKHPEFRINDRDALENIKRKGTSSKKAGAAAATGSGAGGSAADELLNKVNKLQATVESLQKDNLNLNNQLSTLDSKYKYLTNYIGSMKSLQEANYASANLLINSLSQNGIKLPQLDFPDPSSMMGTGHKARPSMDYEQLQPRMPQASTQVQGSPASRTAPPQHQHSHSHGSIGGGTGRSLASQSPIMSPHQQPLAQQTGQFDEVKKEPKTPQPIMTTNIPNPKFHVLLVEDDNVCIQLCRKFLVKYGCQVTVVTDGLNAISTVENNKYDLVLMDIVMPNLDGATATSIIRSFDTRTPIIAMTGNIRDDDLVNYLQNGMSDILAKPFTKDDLYSILTKHLLAIDPNTASLPTASQLQSPADSAGQLAPVGAVPAVGTVGVGLPAAPAPVQQGVSVAHQMPGMGVPPTDYLGEDRELKKQRTS